MSDLGPHARLEGALTSLGERLELPMHPDIAPRVIVHLNEHPVPERERWVVRWRPVLSAATGVAVVAVMMMMFSPATRDAVADWIGLDSVRITYGPPPEEPLAEDLFLGEAVGLEQASERVGFPVLVPGALGSPDEIYVDRAEIAWLVYSPGDDLPRTDETGIGALIGQFEATIDDAILAKQAFGGVQVEAVKVAGVDGFWLSEGPHQLYYLDENGRPRQDLTRLAGNTLLWERDGIVYRVESSLNLARALEIADSMF